MLTMCERRWSRDTHHHAGEGKEEGFGLLLICYVSDLSKKVACGGREVRSAAFARVRRAIDVQEFVRLCTGC